ncbi:MAG: hypothetical protein PHO42_02185 [Candidatus Omnitrophica bacterium]|nr:hypothetical protein [Candidatus Omnitrophota bacterium]
MKVIEAIGKGFNIAGRSFSVLGVLFVFNTAWNLVTIPYTGAAQNAARQKINPGLLGFSLIFILINIFIQGGLFGALKDAVISNGKATLNNFIKYGGRFYARFVGLGALFLAAIILVIVILAILFGMAVVAKNIALGIILAAVAVILAAIALYYFFIFFLSPYILAVEDANVFKALSGSYRFIKANFGRMTGLMVLLVLIGFGIGFIMGILTGALSFVIKGPAFQFLTGIITGAVNSYITLIISAALIVYYCGLTGADQEKIEQMPPQGTV